MATALTTLVGRVVLQAPGLADPAAEMHLLDTAIDFCRDTLPVVEDLAPVSVTAGDATYTLSVDTERRVVKVMRLKLGDLTLEPVAPDVLPNDWQDAVGTPTHYFQRNETDLVLYPAPDANGTLVVTAALAPTRTATTLDDLLADRWLDGLVAGALERALLTPGQPYTDPGRAAYFRNEYGRAKADAAVQTARGYTRAPLRVLMQSF